MVDTLEEKLARLSADQNLVSARLEESDRDIGSLNSEIKDRRAESSQLKQRQADGEQAVRIESAEKAQSDSELAAANHKLAEAQASLQLLKMQLDEARTERTTEVQEAALLEGRLERVSADLKDRNLTIQQQRVLLAYDRDIRDLIGARDLYMAELTDVGRNAETRKPFGRVIFTKGKSLIVYAYDLDQQPGLKRASAFQAWGRRGQSFSDALPIGILFLDSSTNRRWVMKFDDPAALAKIDAVFVTVEPRGEVPSQPASAAVCRSQSRTQPPVKEALGNFARRYTGAKSA